MASVRAKLSVRRRQASRGLALFGGVLLLSATVVNPWIGARWRQVPIVDVADVMLTYAIWATALGVTQIFAGWAVANLRRPLVDRLVLTWVSVTCILILDRALLAAYGLPLWMAHPTAHYRHRPGVVRSFDGNPEPDLVYRINRHGYHDDEFPAAKPPGELRGVMLGDSITMGYRVVCDDTFSNQLERLLAAGGTHARRVQVINAGVSGYTTQQELEAFRDALRFEPDFAAVGFCLNDLSEPFVVQRAFGGPGRDYHGVAEGGGWLGSYLVNETGLGRWLHEGRKEAIREEIERRFQQYPPLRLLREAAGGGPSPKLQMMLDYTLTHLGKIYSLAAERRIPIVLLLFPQRYQLGIAELQGFNRLLKEHAADHGVAVIDFAEVWESCVFDAEVVARLRSQGHSARDIHRLHAKRISEFFMDVNHLKPAGHAVVANKLYEHLVESGIVDAPQREAPVCPAPEPP